MLADDKKTTITAILSKLREGNPKIGEYEKSILHTDLKFHVKLSNGRIVFQKELVEDFEMDPAFVTEAQLRSATETFKLDDLPSATASFPPAKTPAGVKNEFQSPKPGRRLAKRVAILAFIIIAVIIVSKKFQEWQYEERVKTHIYDYVKANGSEYTYSALGGISNFSVTVTNETKFTIDNVRVKIIYIKSNGETWKEEFLSFNYLSPYESRKIKAPDSERGTKLEYQIVSIASNELSLY
jgi:hypothetical protein